MTVKARCNFMTWPLARGVGPPDTTLQGHVGALEAVAEIERQEPFLAAAATDLSDAET